MTDEPRPLWSTLIDVAVYAPIGAVLHGSEAVEQLASKGRQDVRNARVIGQLTLDRGRREADRWAGEVGDRVGDLLATVARATGAPLWQEQSPPSEDDATPPDTADDADAAAVSDHAGDVVETTGAAPPEAAPAPPEAPAAPDAESLAIPDYDNLAASQVVPRLEDLAESELIAVESYERAHRGRMTVLSRIAQLRAG